MPLAANAAIEQEPSSSPVTLAQVAGKIRGHIVDATTGEPIVGASIRVKGNKRIGEHLRQARWIYLCLLPQG